MRGHPQPLVNELQDVSQIKHASLKTSAQTTGAKLYYNAKVRISHSTVNKYFGKYHAIHFFAPVVVAQLGQTGDWGVFFMC